jgi:hypothetical protein
MPSTKDQLADTPRLGTSQQRHAKYIRVMLLTWLEGILNLTERGGGRANGAAIVVARTRIDKSVHGSGVERSWVAIRESLVLEQPSMPQSPTTMKMFVWSLESSSKLVLTC